MDEDPAPNQWAPIRGKGVADVQDVSSVMPFDGGAVAGVPPSPYLGLVRPRETCHWRLGFLVHEENLPNDQRLLGMEIGCGKLLHESIISI